MYNHVVVPVVLVVVYFYFGRQRGQLHCCLNILHCDSERIKLYCDNSFRVEVGRKATGKTPSGFMPYMTVASIEMSDEPDICANFAC